MQVLTQIVAERRQPRAAQLQILRGITMSEALKVGVNYDRTPSLFDGHAIVDGAEGVVVLAEP